MESNRDKKPKQKELEQEFHQGVRVIYMSISQLNFHGKQIVIFHET